MTAVIEALRKIPDGARAVVHSDSAYVIDGITRYIQKWRQNGFLKTDKTPVGNQDLWEALDALSGPRVEYRKVPAHAGNRENECANDIAQTFSQKKKIRLRDEAFDVETASLASGRLPPLPRVRYPVYVVFEKGALEFYREWEKCRMAVEGRRGVRYKKCKSAEELAFTLENWGVRSTS